MFSIDKKLKLTLSVILLLSFALTTPALAGAIIGSTITIADDTLEEVSPAVAYNSDREEYLVVWYNDRADNDDIRAQRLDKNGAKVSGPFYIVGGDDGNNRRYPDVAYNSLAKQYLVVWENEDSNTSLKSIRARRISGTGAPEDAADITIMDGTADITPLKPAVAYAQTADRYMVVWEETVTSSSTYIINASTIESDGTPGSVFPISNVDTIQKYNPDIAYNHNVDRHLVVWEEDDGTTLYEIKGRQVTGAGSVTGFLEFLISNYTVDTINPAVAAIATSPGNIKFLVAFQLDTAGGYDIYGKFIEEDETINSQIIAANTSNNENVPAVAGSEGAQEYLVVWHEATGTGEKTIKARQYTSAGVDMGVIHGLDGPATDNPAVAAGRLGDFLIAWQDQPLLASSIEIFGSLFGYRSFIPLMSH